MKLEITYDEIIFLKTVIDEHEPNDEYEVDICSNLIDKLEDLQSKKPVGIIIC